MTRTTILILLFVLCSVSVRSQEFGPLTFACPPCGCEGDTLREPHEGACPHCGMPLVGKSPLQNVVFLIYDGMQLADFSGIFSVFEGSRSFNLATVGKSSAPVHTYIGEVAITPGYSFATCPKADILIIPGGGVGPQLRDPEVMEWVVDQANNASLVVSVCTGAFILAKTGLIDGLKTTILDDDRAQLERAAPDVTVVPSVRFVDNGKFLSAAGPLSGIDTGLHMLTRIFGNAERAEEVARYLDYPIRE
ncbi:MAG: DJ-1/PfpI family protein [Ignavibacteria bacterium]|nr:DJ-1/PfpI family protein [Ignavibacteria bacterium]